MDGHDSALAILEVVRGEGRVLVRQLRQIPEAGARSFEAARA